MLTLNNAIKPILLPIFAGALALILVSCGTQNRVTESNDGIYSGSNKVSQETTFSDESRSNYYQQYFQAKSSQYESALEEEDVIFTDIDAYSTTERLDESGNIVIENNYSGGYGPWGENSENTTVNIYNYGGFGHGYGFGYYYPYYRWGWGYPYGYFGSYWSIGFGWGWGYPYYGYYGYYGPGYYGYPYYASPYYYNYYPSYYGNSHTAYNRGRRNTDYSRSADRGRSNDLRNRGTYSRNENSRRINQNNVSADGVRNYSQINRNTDRSGRNSVENVRSNQIERNTNTPNVRGNQIERNTRSTNIRTTTPNNTKEVRSNQNVRQNNQTIQTNPGSRTRSYSPPARTSNPTIRSSGGTIRSSGGGGGVRTSSGGRGRG